MLLPLFACLMLVLTGLSGMAHAAESVGGSMVGVEFSAHAPGDGDEVPADSDNGLPHHHNSCHGHDVGTPAVTPAPCEHQLASGPTGAPRGPALRDSVLGVLPRPPKA